MATFFGNGTEPLVGWQPEPLVRGTFNILSTCLLTIIICVWTAVHMDLPEDGKAKWYWFFWRKSLWVIVGLLAPEVVVAVAWDQRQEAKGVLKVAREKFGQDTPPWVVVGLITLGKWKQKARTWFRRSEDRVAPTPSVPNKRPDWTMVHGFYAVMGGFTLDIGTPDTSFFPGNRTKICLLPDGLKYLLRNGNESLIPWVHKEDILDRSKASMLAKSLVCIQVLWFCAQCITRLAQRLPISLLELNTFGHSICALLIYLLWLEKPLEVNQSTIIQAHGNDKIRNLAAAMWTGSPCSLIEYKFPSSVWFTLGIKHELDLLYRVYTPPDDAKVFSTERSEILFTPQTPLQKTIARVSGLDPKARVITKDDLRKTRWRIVRPGPEPKKNGEFCADEYSYNTLDTSLGYEKRWEQRHDEQQERKSEEGTQQNPKSPSPQGSGSEMEPCPLQGITPSLRFNDNNLMGVAKDPCYYQKWLSEEFETPPHGFVATKSRVSDRPRLNLNKRAEFFSLAGLVYGGLHCLAWNAQFINSTHRILWQISCVVIISSGLVLILAESIRAGFAKLAEGKGKSLRYILYRTVDGSVLGFLWGVLLPVYLFARGYLVVECFISLFQSPIGIYSVPHWSSYLPHIG